MPLSEHPGVMLERDFLRPLGFTQVALASHLGIPVQRVNELVRGKRGVSPETAWLLGSAFDVAPEFWLDLQRRHDLAASRPARLPGPIASKLDLRRRAWESFEQWQRTVADTGASALEWLREMWTFIAEHDPRPPRDPETIAEQVASMHRRLSAIR